MAYKFVIGTFFAWILMALICGGFQGSLVASSGGYETNVINRFLAFQVSTDKEAFSQTGVVATLGFFQSVADVITFNFPSIFYGNWVVFRWLLVPIAAAWVIALIAMIRGVATS